MALSNAEWLVFEKRMWGLPKSVCYCGHKGDGPHGDHGDYKDGEGLGGCNYEGCLCGMFKWKAWLPEAKRVLREMGGLIYD